jgi:hypothetical protein
MCEAVSACPARRRSSSLAELPAGCCSAASLNLIASSDSRSAKVASAVVSSSALPKRRAHDQHRHDPSRSLHHRRQATLDRIKKRILQQKILCTPGTLHIPKGIARGIPPRRPIFRGTLSRHLLSRSHLHSDRPHWRRSYRPQRARIRDYRLNESSFNGPSRTASLPVWHSMPEQSCLNGHAKARIPAPASSIQPVLKSGCGKASSAHHDLHRRSYRGHLRPLLS